MASRLDRRWICHETAPEGGWPISGRKRRLIRGGGSIAQIAVVSDDILTSRDVNVSCVGAVRPLKTVAPLSGAVRNDVRLLCSDSEESDDDVLPVGAMVPMNRPAMCCSQ